MRNQLSRRDLETLSAYLDGQLSARQRSALEARLAVEENLQHALEDLRATRSVLRQAPKARAPRNFTLTPEMAGIHNTAPRLYPMMRLVSAVASILFIFVFAGDLLSSGSFAAQNLRGAPAMESVQMQEAAAPAEEDLGEAGNAFPEAADFVDKSDESALPPLPTSQPEESAADIAAEEPAAEPMEEAAEAEGAVEDESLAAGSAPAEENLPTPTLAGTPLLPETTAIARIEDDDAAEPSFALEQPSDNEYGFEAAAPKELEETYGNLWKSEFPVLQILEWGLGLIALGSGGIALWLRKRR